MHSVYTDITIELKEREREREREEDSTGSRKRVARFIRILSIFKTTPISDTISRSFEEMISECGLRDPGRVSQPAFTDISRREWNYV